MNAMRNSTYYLDENHTFMIKSNILWLKVFYHNATFGDYFSSTEETLDSHTPQKFSILKYIDDSFKVREKFEFLLEIPGIRGFNRWRQLINPKETKTETNETTNEYQPVKISWPWRFFGGLSRSNSNHNAFFDCSAGNNDLWWYPIGARRRHTIDNTIPLIGDRYQGPEIALWIRFPSLSIDGFKLTACIYRRTHFNFVCCSIFLLVS